MSEGQLGIALLMAAVGALLAMPLAGAAAHRYGSRAVTALDGARLRARPARSRAGARARSALGGVLLLFGAAFATLDVAMNAQGVAVERRLPAADHVLAARHVQPRRHGRRRRHRADRRRRDRRCCRTSSRSARWSRRRAWRPAGRCCRPRGGGRAGARASRGPRGRCCCRGSWRSPGCSSEGAIADWSAVYLSNSLGAGTSTAAAAAFAAFSLAMAAGRFSGDRLVAAPRRRPGRAGGRRARRGRARPDAADRPPAGRGAGLRPGRRRPRPASSRSCSRPRRARRACRRAPRSPRSARSATVGFLIGPPAIGGLAELLGLPAALGLVVALCALIAALGSRAPARRAGALDLRLSRARASAPRS